MTEAATEAVAEDRAAPAGGAGVAVPPPAGVPTRWFAWVVALLVVLGVVSLAVAWQAQQRLGTLQQELVRRQQDSQGKSTEALMLAKQAQDSMRETTARVALLEARLAEVAVQRGQLEELIQSLSRSRDENLLVDIDSGIRVATQQTAITGSAEPLVAALKQADERLARYNQPRLEGVRRAIARDLDRVKGIGMADIPSLSIKLDEAVRLVDELPLLAVAEPRKAASAAAPAGPRQSQRSAPSDTAASGWAKAWNEAWGAATQRVWSEVKSLVRVTSIEHPDAMLLVPEQAYFVRENLKLRLLNARIALLSRQFDIAQTDLALAQTTLDRYFDHSSRRLTLTAELIKQVIAQARQHGVARPDDTLAALAAASAGR
ncbi:uroporphyrinogen-III C-methyltransferase [Piscinibacter sp.]|uniref:uroporphyrinogen-III C-methyltransferase n=1 Tax=Piscinibacter sp. TaxID=1903157 RepID=UPI00355A66E2